MNSYFASVEQQANPLWRGKALGVAAGLYRGACLIATSKEAKAKGIVTGMRVVDGLTRDPALVIVEVDPAKYRSATERIFAIMAQESEQIETYSIDEAFLDLTGWVQSLDEAATIGWRIQRRIHDEVAEWLTASAGVAPTRWLAKFASDTAPKGQLVVLEQKHLAAYLAGRELTEAWGIARRLECRLKALGIHTLGELRRYPVTNLIASLGVRGYELWANVNGIEVGTVTMQGLPKSIGHSHVLKQRTKDLGFSQRVLMKLAERTGRRLRSLDLEGHEFWLWFSTAEGGGGGGRRLSFQPIVDSRTIFRLAWTCFAPQASGQTPSALALGLGRLRPRSRQAALWPERRDLLHLAAALDALNDRYGEQTVVYGAQFGLSDEHAPDRIGFRKTVSWDVPLDQMLANGYNGSRHGPDRSPP